MTNYYIKTLVINFHQTPFTIKLISNSKEENDLQSITLKGKLNSYLTINESLPQITLIKHIFELFLRPLLNQKILIAAAINGGGDIQTGVANNQDYVWNIAIENPNNTQKNIYTYHLQNGAIATENSKPTISNTNTPPLKQATIVSSNLIEANDLAIKAIDLGEQQFSKFAQQQDIHGVLINQKNTITILE